MVPCPEEVFGTGLDLLQRQIGPALSLRRVRKANDQGVGAPRASLNLLWAGLGGTRESAISSLGKLIVCFRIKSELIPGWRICIGPVQPLDDQILIWYHLQQ